MSAAPESTQSWLLAADPLGRWAAYAERSDILYVARLPEQSMASASRWQGAVPEGIASLSASRDGRWLAVGHQVGGCVALWAPVDEGLSSWIEVSRATLRGAHGAVEVAFSPVDDSLAVACGDKLQLLRLNMDELDRVRQASASQGIRANAPKRLLIRCPSEHERYAELLASALELDLKVDWPTRGLASDDWPRTIELSAQEADAILVFVGNAALWESDVIRQAKGVGAQVILIQVSGLASGRLDFHGESIANTDAHGRVLALGNLHGNELARVVNSTAVNILNMMDIDAAPFLYELQHTFDDTPSRYFNPPEEVSKQGRRLLRRDFRKLVLQLKPDESLIGLYRNGSSALVAAHVSSRSRLRNLESASLTPLGFFALSREVAEGGWNGEAPDPDQQGTRPIVVVSYVRTYAALAQALVSALEQTGQVDVHYDGNLSIGETFPEAMLNWIDQADMVVVLAGPASANSRYSKAELERADELKKPVLAVVVEGGHLPAALSSRVAANSDEKRTQKSLVHLKGRRLDKSMQEIARKVVQAATNVLRDAKVSSTLGDHLIPASIALQSEEPSLSGTLSGTPSAPSRTLKLGDAGPDVVEVQEMLSLNASGEFDAATVEAVRRFQRDHGLSADGVVGAQTRQVLVQVAGQRSEENFGLTARQSQVMGLVLRGLSNKQIARELNISEGVVKHHVSAALSALNVSNRAQAVSLMRRSLASSPAPSEFVRPASPRGGRRAVVSIGVDRVEGLPSLRASAVSAKAFADWATNNQRIPSDHVVLLTDSVQPVRARDIYDAIALLLLVEDLDQLLVFFAGHGVVANQRNLWLLTDALVNPNEAVNLDGAAEMARSNDVRHVVFISDASRELDQIGSNGDLIGSVIFPRAKATTKRCEVDRLFSTGIDGRSYEVKSSTSKESYESVFTSVLLDALSGMSGDSIQTYRDRRVVTTRSILDFVLQEMTSRLDSQPGRPRQVPEFYIESGSDRWLASF